MKKFNFFAFSCLMFFFLAGSAGPDTYSIEARNAPAADLIRLILSLSGKNVVIPGELDKKVTASFPEIRLEDALKSVLNSHQLVGSESNNVVTIFTQKALEESGKDLNTVSFPLKYAKAKDIAVQARTLMGMAGKSSVFGDVPSNTLIVNGNEDQIKSVRKLVDTIDKVDKQVLIEARIVEASKTFTRNLGVQWGINGSAGPVTFGGIASSPTSRNSNLATPSSNPLSGAAASFGPFGNTTLDLQLSAGEENGDLSILSRPSIVTMNNQPATIRSGLKFYIRTAGNVTISAAGGAGGTGSGISTAGADTGTAAGGANAGGATSGNTAGASLSEISSGITLVVTPHITPDNKISLTINVVSSQPDFSKLVADIPSIADNTATTTVLLDNGATTVIGGLSQATNSKSTRGIPGLNKIPLLGPLLFGSSAKEKSKREVIIFVTPRVVEEAVKDLHHDDG